MLEQLTYHERLRGSIEGQPVSVVPLTASLGINDWCNSKCTYCDIWLHPVKEAALPDLEHAVDELAELGVSVISLTGGEPFLHRGLASIVARIHAHGLISSSMTNGLLLRSNRLVAALEAGLNSLVLSLDSVNPVSYKATRGVPLAVILKGLDQLLEERARFPKLRVSINCVVSRANLHDLVPLVEYCHARDVSVGFQPLHAVFGRRHDAEPTESSVDLTFGPMDRAHLEQTMARLVDMKEAGFAIDSSVAYLEAFPRFLTENSLPATFRCVAGFTTIAIDVALNVRSCWSMRSIGNLREHSLRDIWFSPTYAERRTAMLNLVCPKCWLRCHTEHRDEAAVKSFIEGGGL
jgi:MoaA/NifB/PqqE/SkfB family radical SAM enzyme